MAEMNLFGYTSEKDLMAAFNKRANKRGNEMAKKMEKIEKLALLVAKRGRPIHKTCQSCKTPQKLFHTRGTPKEFEDYGVYRHEATGKLSCGE